MSSPFHLKFQQILLATKTLATLSCQVRAAAGTINWVQLTRQCRQQDLTLSVGMDYAADYYHKKYLKFMPSEVICPVTGWRFTATISYSS
ncbi:hypothetical protein [Arsukibacterium tuosuense]|uniref:hypothetical protein n=1 Tax=Arsukibacterium tuosuense TaxID=1323745 RepID=UPI001143D559|nr:hypothetical protein [Arsukibacterium tuosuense]